ncbi:hypothetical protein K435DRAFT_872867 [Dendrothele bispora CBS 962.96]|uniref:Uncharacterized protein n=1 Tax=Dendrothele bispora (strain CBS 962.96) TaxID=1314807 RepID=A0A4S8L1Q9_DENBC|nr:hypothetical protein K435DRAFT_872867 [Dendrothele bispora CBS 962.96]
MSILQDNDTRVSVFPVLESDGEWETAPLGPGLNAFLGYHSWARARRRRYAVKTGATAQDTLDIMLLSDLFLSLSILAGLLDSVTYEQLERFIQLTTNLRNDILSAQPCNHDPTIPPVQLSDHQRFFLAHVCDIDLTYIDQCWTAVKDIVWFRKYDQTCRFNDQDFLAWNDAHRIRVCRN